LFYKFKIRVEQYDGCTVPSSNVEIENKYVRRTPFSVYCLVFSAYVYTYVALYIRRCLKCELCELCLLGTSCVSSTRLTLYF
jgi:hypothetical protein